MAGAAGALKKCPRKLDQLNLIGSFSELNPNVAAAIVAAIATVFVSMTSIVLTRRYEMKQIVIKEHGEKKVPIYEDLIKFWFEISMAEKLEKSYSEKEINEFFAKFLNQFMIWGSDDVIKAFTEFRKEGLNQEDSDGIKSLFSFERFIFSVRKDLGHKNKNLKQGDVLRFFVTDIDKYLPSGN